MPSTCDSFTRGRITRRAFALGLLPLATGTSLAGVPAAKRNERPAVFATESPFGAKCDGVTDDTAAIQKAIDHNKGGTIIIPGRALCAGVFLDGSSYNGTMIVCQGELVLKPRPSKSTGLFSGVWVGLIFKDCQGIVLQYRGDGNRKAQPDEEHCHLVGLAGVKDFECPQFFGREIRGDGIYISQSDWLHESGMSDRLRFGTVRVVNSEDDGRNAMSIISGRNISIDRFVSKKIGGVVGGLRQPGGLDIEPNKSFQRCEDIVVRNAIVESSGAQCFGVVGRDSGQPEDWIVRRIRVGSLRSTNTLGANSGNFYAAAFRGVDGLDVQGTVSQTALAGTGLLVDNAKNANVRIHVGRAGNGVVLGAKGWVRNSKFDIQVASYGSQGIMASGLSNTSVSGTVEDGEGASPVAMLATSHGRDIQQENVHYSLTIPRASAMQRGYVNDPTNPVRFAKCSVSYSDRWGYPDPASAISGFGTGVTVVKEGTPR